MCCGQDGEGTPKACWTSTHFPLTAPAKTTFPPRTPPLFLHPSRTPPPLLNPPSLPPPPLLPSSPRSIHLGATLIQVSLLSILHPPSSQPQPFSSQPQFPIDLLIAVCLWESGRSLPLSLCSPLHGFVFPFPSFLLPLSLSSPSPSPHRCSSSET